MSMTDSKKSYVVVTPVKNEGVNLPDLIQSMASQTLKPVLWVIVDDGSTDSTSEIIREAEGKYNWIRSIRVESDKRDLGLHLAGIVREGFNVAITYCERNGIKYSYIGNLDGDLTLEHTFYENIIKEFEKDPELGVASGGTQHIIGDRIIYARVEEDEPSGGHMLIRRECYDECGGIPLSYSWDSVIKAKARLRGWKTRRFEENIATEARDVGSAEGHWGGFFHYGKSEHYLCYNPIHVLIKGMKYMLRKPYHKGIAYLIGYLSSTVRREKQIEDEEVRKYFWNKWKSIYKRRLFGMRY